MKTKLALATIITMALTAPAFAAGHSSADVGVNGGPGNSSGPASEEGVGSQGVPGGLAAQAPEGQGFSSATSKSNNGNGKGKGGDNRDK